MVTSKDTRPIRVLHVSNIAFGLPYFIGGQFDYFKKTKNVEFYVACAPSEALSRHAKTMNFKPCPIPLQRKISPFSDIRAIIKLMRIIKVEKINIVVGHTPKAALIGMVAARVSKVKKRIYFRHGLLFQTSVGLKRRILVLMEKLTGSLADQVVCVSPSILKESERNKLNRPDKNILLGQGTCNGIDLNYFSKKAVNELELEALRNKMGLSPQDTVVGFVGRIVNDKGIPELIEAWKLLKTFHTNLKLLLVGPFEARDGISSDIKRYILEEPSILFVNLVEDVRPYYALMDIFVLPSRREGLPTVVLEASAMELPVITTRATGCIDSIVENRTGIFSDLDPKALHEGVSYYLENPQIAKSHGKAGRAFVLNNFEQTFIWNKIKSEVLAL